MTSDQKFLKSARIEPCEIPGNWMEWRTDELNALREVAANWIAQAREEAHRACRWRLCAFAGWLLAVMVGAIPVIERMTQ